MAKSPAFRFYVGDFLVGTMHMTAEEIGAYLLLLCHQWDQGHVPDDQTICAKIARCQASTVASIWHKFGICHDGKRKNPRMETERSLQLEFREKQASNGAKRWKKSGGNASAEPSLSGGNASAEPSLSGGNASAEPSLSGGNASRGQCLLLSSSLSEDTPIVPKGDNANTVTSLPDAAEKKEGAGPVDLALDAARRCFALFGADFSRLSSLQQARLTEHADCGALPLSEKKWGALAAMRAERTAIQGLPDDINLRHAWLISKDSLIEHLPKAADIAFARHPGGSPPARTPKKKEPANWRETLAALYPAAHVPGTFSDLPGDIRAEIDKALAQPGRKETL